MTTTNPFSAAARERAWPAGSEYAGDGVGGRADLSDAYTDGFEAGAEWARSYLAAQEPTDAECVAALDVKYGGPLEPYGAPYDDEEIEETRAALSAYRAIRRDEENR